VSVSRKLQYLLLLWFVAGIAAAIALALLQPGGPLKWALRLVALVPVVVLVNVAVDGGAHLFMSLPGMKQGTHFFEKRAEGKQFSAARAAWYGFSAVLGFVVVVAGATAVWQGYLLVRDFVAQDKCLDGGGQWRAEARECQHQSGSAR
jgi:hypothetical protein